MTPTGVQPLNVDAELAPGVVEENAVLAVLPLLRWAPGARHTFSAFSGRQGVARTLTLAVAGTEQVTVPAGTFATYRVEQTGGESPISYYVTTAAPHRVVRITFAGQPVEFVLAP